MVREEGTDDEVNRLFGLEGEDVGGDPANGACRRAGLGCDGDGVGVDVEAGEFDSNAARAGPALDAAQGVAIAAADVEDVERLREPEGGTKVSSHEEAGGRRGTSD